MQPIKSLLIEGNIKLHWSHLGASTGLTGLKKILDLHDRLTILLHG